jgi:RNA-directed DNA polymerase
MPNPLLLSTLARAFLSGETSVEQIVARGNRTLGRPWRWLRYVARRYVESIAGKTRPRRRDVIQFILRDSAFRHAWSKHQRELSLHAWQIEPPRMQPAAAVETWDLPVIESAGDLADWLWLEPGDLEWFADLKGLGYKLDRSRLRHYHYRVLAKLSGGLRLIEAPKSRLKKLQREILSGILEKIPPHPAAQGFLKGRSIKTFAAPHVGQHVVLRMDLRDFFPSFPGVRIQTFFRTLGYPESVADLLGGICTNAGPRDVWKSVRADTDPTDLQAARVLYSRPHLPQGAPTSPALANLCFFRMDCRLSGLAKSAGAQYSRYADDLAFSGSEQFERHIDRFSTHVAAILLEEGFSVNHRKTRVMRQGVRQHLAGLVVNQCMNVRRSDFDSLKATLTNCVRFGPENQNRDAHAAFRSHLDGRVAFVEMVNPAKGARLRARFEQIKWPS